MTLELLSARLALLYGVSIQPPSRAAATKCVCNRLLTAFSCFNPQPPFRAAATSPPITQASTMTMFQSSAALSSGCNDDGADTAASMPGFNPQPPFRAAATSTLITRCRSVLSFNPQPPFRAAATAAAHLVRRAVFVFQSSAALSSGCNTPGTNQVKRFYQMFQSSAALSSGCNAQAAVTQQHPQKVSILSRPFERLQRHDGRETFIIVLFQSSAALSSGCNTAVRGDGSKSKMFQSSAALSSGCNF